MFQEEKMLQEGNSEDLLAIFQDDVLAAALNKMVADIDPQYLEGLSEPHLARVIAETITSQEFVKISLAMGEAMEHAQQCLQYIRGEIFGYVTTYHSGIRGIETTYTQSKHHEAKATCVSCNTLAARGLFDTAIPESSLVFAPENLIWSDNSEEFTPEGLRCADCGNLELLVERGAVIYTLEPNLTRQQKIAQTKQVIERVAKKILEQDKISKTRSGMTLDEHYNSTAAYILSGLSLRFDVFEDGQGTESKKKGKKRKHKRAMPVGDFERIWNIFYRIVNHHIDFDSLPDFCPRDPRREAIKEVLLPHQNQDGNYGRIISPAYVSCRQRIKDFERLSDKVMQALYFGRPVPRDVYGLKFVFSSRTMLHNVAGFIEAKERSWDIDPDRTKDYYRNPKQSGYKAIHYGVKYGNVYFEIILIEDEANFEAEVHRRQARKKRRKNTVDGLMLPDHEAYVERQRDALRTVPAGAKRLIQAIFQMEPGSYAPYVSSLVDELESKLASRVRNHSRHAFALSYVLDHFEQITGIPFEESMSEAFSRYEKLKETYFVRPRLNEQWTGIFGIEDEAGIEYSVPRQWYDQCIVPNENCIGDITFCLESYGFSTKETQTVVANLRELAAELRRQETVIGVDPSGYRKAEGKKGIKLRKYVVDGKR